MPFVNPDKTFLEQADRVSKFEDACADVIDRQGSLKTDARRIHLENIRSAATASSDILRILHWCEQAGNTSLAGVLGLADATHGQMHQQDLLRAGRLFFLVETQFQIETMFRNILAALGQSVPNGFYNVAKNVLAASGILDQGAKLDLLNIPALMRNSMHTNGLHHGFRNSSTNIKINGVDFDFNHGKKVDCGSWLHITTALSSSIGIIEEILQSAPVTSLPLIDDEYSKQPARIPKQQAPL
jgi:hypothetical protein